MTSRKLAAEQSAASLRLEGLVSSSEADALAREWAAGRLSDEALAAAADRIAAGRPAREVLDEHLGARTA